MVIVVALVLGMGIVLFFIGLATSGRGSGISARLERYTAAKPEPASTTVQPGVGIGDVLAHGALDGGDVPEHLAELASEPFGIPDGEVHVAQPQRRVALQLIQAPRQR